MSRSLGVSLFIPALLAAWLFAAGNAQAADQESLRQKEPVYGSQLMTPEERSEHRLKMRAARSVEEQAKIRQEHHEKMWLRAEERGLTLPDQVPAEGGRMRQRMRHCDGAARPCPMMASQQRSETAQGNRAEVAYVSGGIGDDDPVDQLLQDYNLKLVFALKGRGEYLADVKVAIHDLKGKKVLEADSPGPLFLARLPPGQYRINADFHGKSLTRSAGIKQGGRSVVSFLWDKE